MRKLSIAAAVSLSLSGVTGLAHALGLGEIEMYSALNQKLDAEIAILSATDEEINSMQVRLASPSAFARAGLQLSPSLSSVGFTVGQRPDGKPVVKVSSDNPVAEPFLNFLLEVDAPGSVTLIREYTVLLDPPSFVVEEGAGDSRLASSSSTSEGADAGPEVSFTETSLGTFNLPKVMSAADEGTPVPLDTIVNKDPDPSTLFVPDDQVLSSGGGSSIVDSGGRVVALDQQSNGADIQGQVVPLDGIGDEISASELDASGELLAGDELAELAGNTAIFAERIDETVVEFAETPVADTGSVFVADVVTSVAEVRGSDSDNQGSVIDLSGVISESAATVPVAAAPRSSATELSGNTHRIRTDDTLWSIANAQKASGVDAYQMIVSILNANPDAFVDGNMNLMRRGAVLQIPTEASQRSVNAADAFAIVNSWTRNNKPPVNRSDSSFNYNQPAIEEASVLGNNDLDDINEQVEQAQYEVATGTSERDDLQGRVDSLSTNMEEMKSLITVRESELNRLQDEVTAAESDAAAIDAQISQLTNASETAAATQENLSTDLNDAQEAIALQADVDKNLATAEAEAKAVMLASEEDALRSQLAALELEKQELQASAQLERAALVQESEAEKNRLIQQAKAEREQILGDLEIEKARITNEAELEIARAKEVAEVENQQILEEAKMEREKVAAETEQLKAKLAEMELQQTETEVAFNDGSESAEPSRVKDRLAKSQQEGQMAPEPVAITAAEPVAETAVAMVKGDGGGDSDSDGEGTMAAMDKLKEAAGEAGGSVAAGGSAAVGGLLGFAPLGDVVGNRKTVLAAGAGLSLLGLLGAWGLRRRKINARDPNLRPDNRPIFSAKTRSAVDRDQAMYGGDVHPEDVKPQRRSSSAAAAAAAAAAAVTGTAAVKARGSDAPKAVEPLARKIASSKSTQAAAKPQPELASQPAVKNTPQAKTAAEIADAELDETALDDTITEAEVYLRYGLHGQAEDLLKTAIDRSPNNAEYHFKLLENYHDQKDPEKFKALAEDFNGKFPTSGHSARIAEMTQELAAIKDTPTDENDSAESSGSSGSLKAGLAGAASVAGGAALSAKNAAADGVESITGGTEEVEFDLLDQTIDPGSEFNMDELQATGNLDAMAEDADLFDQGGLALDDVDLATLDDDGTMNLEEIAGDQMSGVDLGTLDLTNPDSSFEDVSLTETGLGDLPIDDMTGGIRSGLDSDLSGADVVAGDTDEMETKLDLAKAYIDMQDSGNASKLLEEIAARGNPLQQIEANELLKKLSK